MSVSYHINDFICDSWNLALKGDQIGSVKEGGLFTKINGFQRDDFSYIEIDDDELDYICSLAGAIVEELDDEGYVTSGITYYDSKKALQSAWENIKKRLEEYKSSSEILTN